MITATQKVLGPAVDVLHAGFHLVRAWLWSRLGHLQPKLANQRGGANYLEIAIIVIAVLAIAALVGGVIFAAVSARTSQIQ